MKSMTGYGRATVEQDGNAVTVEISSVNSRKQIDMRVSVPRELGILESEFRQIAQKQLSRGTFQVAVSCTLAPEARQAVAVINKDVAIAAIAQLRDTARAVGIPPTDISIHDLLAIPGVIAPGDSSPYEPLKKLAVMAFEKALADLDDSRNAEGQRLLDDLIARGDTIRSLVDAIASREHEAITLLKQKLQERIASLGLDLPIDDEKLAREVIFYVEKADITEETVRLKSHLVKYAQLLRDAADPGRDLDILGQEMNREANTLSAKTADMTIAELALKLKTELSRIREQIMNVE